LGAAEEIEEGRMLKSRTVRRAKRIMEDLLLQQSFFETPKIELIKHYFRFSTNYKL
jgi:hypothetical protein